MTESIYMCSKANCSLKLKYLRRGKWYKMVQNRYEIMVAVFTPFGGKEEPV